MTRKITTHEVNDLNEAITLTARDNPGHGGANHFYRMEYVDPRNPSTLKGYTAQTIHFQEGPVSEEGINGITNEVLLAIVEDRLAGFQRGKFACEENEEALFSVRQALQHLKRRTVKRMERGVEGTHQV